ncbi:hypothetical protein [Mesobacillus foraminis]|uniref:hypothetical protein n=1 Tax=Mesobacillus foraminis TaxID=279826 RepID=UPI00130501B4|nr:hypothetical protein [Mesobacillus foraminis]
MSSRRGERLKAKGDFSIKSVIMTWMKTNLKDTSPKMIIMTSMRKKSGQVPPAKPSS